MKVVSPIFLDLNLHAVISAVFGDNKNCRAFPLIALAEPNALIKGEQDSAWSVITRTTSDGMLLPYLQLH